jgi:hypothetical protein
MAITDISRDWGVAPSIVRVTTTDDLATITTAQYLTTQLANIAAIQHGVFEWVTGDLVAISYNGGEGQFTYDPINNTFVLDMEPPGAIELTNSHILVGNAMNVATDVAMTGDIGITDTGVTAIQPGVIVNADINAAAAIAFSKLAALSSADVLLGSAGNVATATAVTGAIHINNTGVTTLQAGVVDLSNLAAGITPSAIVKFSDEYGTIGGAAAEAISIPGALSSDLAFVQLVDAGPNTVSVLTADVTTNTLTVTFSGNPGAGAIINYQLLRIPT